MTHADPPPLDEDDAHEGMPVLSLIRRLQSRELNGKQLAPSDRRACVEHLMLEGYCVAEIAQVLGMSDRTVARDRQAIRSTYALEKDPGQTRYWVGRLVTEWENCAYRIRRAVRESDTPPQVRVEAERAVFSTLNELFQRLQSVGYIDCQSFSMKAELTHRLDPDQATAQLQAELRRLLEHQPDDPVLNDLGRAVLRLTADAVPSSGKEADHAG